MNEWVNVDQLYVGDTVRLDNGELLENITAEQLEQIRSEYEEVELIG